MTDPQVVILAGGLGTGAYPLTLERPKALLPVCNVALLARLLSQMQAAGLGRATLSLQPVQPPVYELLKACIPTGFDLAIVLRAGRFKGQVPAVRELVDPNTPSVLVVYGDSFLSLDFRALFDAHAAARRQGGLATVVYHRPSDLRVPERDGRTYHGVMALDEQGWVRRFVEKPKVDEIRPGFDLANAAVFICDRALFEDPAFGGASNFSYDIFEPAVGTGGLVYAYDIGEGYRHDVGNVARLYELNVSLLRREMAGAPPGTEQAPGFWTEPGAVWEGAEIVPPVLLGRGTHIAPQARVGPDVILGAGCRVEAGATVRQAVLLEECRIGAGSEVGPCILGMSARIGRGVRLPPHTVLGSFSTAGADNWPAGGKA